MAFFPPVFNEERHAEHIREENERRQKTEAKIQQLKREAEMREAVKGLFD